MLIEKINSKTNSPVFKIAFTLIVLSFVVGGMGGAFWSGTDTSVAKVNGTAIEQQRFNSELSRRQNILSSEMGAKFWDLYDTPEYARQFNQSILDSLIDEELLRQYAKDLKLGISAEQIKSEIVNFQGFQQNGKFSNELYQQTLRNNGITADMYAAIVNEGMLQSQIQEGIINSDFSVPAQQDLLAKLLLQQRQVRLSRLSIPQEMENQAVSTEELQAYYTAHKAKLIAPEQVTVEYVSLTPKDVVAKVQITDEQIQTYYDRNRADYVTRGETRAAHIQVATEAEAQAVLDELQAGADFATVAKTKSADKLSAVNGGDLGWAKAGTFPAAFEKAMENLTAGQISSAVKVDNAFHIIKVLERKAETVMSLAQVKENIAETLRNESVLTEYSNAGREMANRAFENTSSLEAVAETAGLTVHKTESFTRSNVPAELQHEKILKAIFSDDLRQTAQNSDALDVGDENNPRTIFVRVAAYQAEREQTFEEAKASIENFVKAEKAEKTLLTKAEESVKALNDGQSADVKFDNVQTLMYMQEQTTDPVLAQTVFSMKKAGEKSSYQIARNNQGDIIIVALDKIIDGSAEQFKQVAMQFDEANKAILRNDLLKDLRAKASVEINEDFIEQLSSQK